MLTAKIFINAECLDEKILRLARNTRSTNFNFLTKWFHTSSFSFENFVFPSKFQLFCRRVLLKFRLGLMNEYFSRPIFARYSYTRKVFIFISDSDSPFRTVGNLWNWTTLSNSLVSKMRLAIVGLQDRPEGVEELKCWRNEKLKVVLQPEVGISSRRGCVQKGQGRKFSH